MSLNTTAVRIKVILKDVKPDVTRRLVVPFALRLDRLHLTLQAAYGWTNSHLFEFFAGEVHWGSPIPMSCARGRRQRIVGKLEAASAQHAVQIDVKRQSKGPLSYAYSSCRDALSIGIEVGL